MPAGYAQCHTCAAALAPCTPSRATACNYAHVVSQRSRNALRHCFLLCLPVVAANALAAAHYCCCAYMPSLWWLRCNTIHSRTPPSPLPPSNRPTPRSRYRGNCFVLGRSSPNSLYSEELVSMDVEGEYDPRTAEGFIKVNALRLREHTRLRGPIKNMPL